MPAQTITGFSKKSSEDAIAKAMAKVGELAQRGKRIVVNSISCSYDEEQGGYVAIVKISVRKAKGGGSGKNQYSRKYALQHEKKYVEKLSLQDKARLIRQNPIDPDLSYLLPIDTLFNSMIYTYVMAKRVTNKSIQAYMKEHMAAKLTTDFVKFAMRIEDLPPEEKQKVLLATRPLIRSFRAELSSEANKQDEAPSSEKNIADNDNNHTNLLLNDVTEIDFPEEQNVFVPFSQSACFPGYKQFYYNPAETLVDYDDAYGAQITH